MLEWSLLNDAKMQTAYLQHHTLVRIGDAGSSTPLLRTRQCTCGETFSIFTRLQWTEKKDYRRG
jgi:hypothetical protein